MNTKITKTLIRKVLRMRKVQWHDRQWHNFMSQAEVEAVEYGIMEVRGRRGGSTWTTSRKRLKGT